MALRSTLTITLALAAAITGPGLAAASTRPSHRPSTGSPYGAHPPRGRVAQDNILNVPAHARGVVMLIHGGAWVFTGPRTLERGQEGWFQAHGWGTYDVDYRGGWPALADVLAGYRHLRKLEGPRTPICLQGQSAGATMAMLVAAARRSVACVISEAAITDLTTLPKRERHLLNKYVFPNHLWAFSPVRVASAIHAPLLMAGAGTDKVVPERRQMAEMRRARPGTVTMLLRGEHSQAWKTNFPHASVTPRALRRFRHAVVGLLDQAARQAGGR
jgi:acetyl esterase/lipase